MDTNLILISTAALGGLGAVSAIMLGVAGRFFKVVEDPRIEELSSILPGANCGGCGYPGCAGYAKALVDGVAVPTVCSAGGPGLAVKIGEILGVSVTLTDRKVARVRCNGTHEACDRRYVYQGYRSCKGATMLVQGGSKACPYGCEGLGDCVDVCLFDAIHIGDDGIPRIDEVKCTACGKCVTACPKKLIALEPHKIAATLACSTRLPGKEVRKICTAGCIGCGMCVRACPYDALKMEDNLPVRDCHKCVNCGLCVDVCKPASMLMARGAVPDPEVRAAAEALAAERKAADAAKKAAAKQQAAAKGAAQAASASASATTTAADGGRQST